MKISKDVYKNNFFSTIVLIFFNISSGASIFKLYFKMYKIFVKNNNDHNFFAVHIFQMKIFVKESRYKVKL